MEDRDFKYSMQDISHVYIGGRMSMGEIVAWEDVPFKIKAIVNKHFIPLVGEEGSIAEAIMALNKETFGKQIIDQLKLRFKVGQYVDDKKGRHYVSKVLKLPEFEALCNSGEEFVMEELIFSKLSLLAFPV